MRKNYIVISLLPVLLVMSLVIVSCPQKGQVGDQEAAQEPETDSEMLRARPGACPSLCYVNWENRKIEQTVCAGSQTDAETRAGTRERVSDAIQTAVRKSCDLDCSSREGCAPPATCQEDWGNARGLKGLGDGWTCTNTGEDCPEGGTKWECNRYYDFRLGYECECQ